ncbi:hypothetical protein [Taibaiella chishuiensis]|uniref:Uncharacterized protein n=1 Tax=Taibaiella chishuiensis TaxID=1434707 RepID=A0A2P8D2L2_9BACT|nr:hypothetical protein [Taibaiella chishuiensis]PSK91462.1 hypothetical protein B0I18_10545 [Taibaiella chishuiensis]
MGKKAGLVPVVLLCLFFSACKKPTDGLSLNIAPQLFEYTVALQFYNAADLAHTPTGVNIRLSGKDAGSMYEISGNKKLTVVDGFISLGLLADRNPDPGNPIQFTVEVTATGCLPVTVPVTILNGQLVQFIPVELVNPSAPPAGVSVKRASISLAGNALPEATTLITPSTQGKQESAILNLPAGLKFKDEAGNTLSGSTLSLTLVHFDARTAAALDAFPGGQRSTNLLRDAQNNTSSAFFQTAGFVYLLATLDGKNVATFTNSAVVTMGVNNQQWNPAAGRNFADGDSIGVFRFTQGTAIWNIAAATKISTSNAKLIAQFNINRTGAHTLARSGNVCNATSIRFNTGIAGTEVFRMDVFAGNDQFTPVYSRQVQVADQESLPLANLPAGNVTVKVYPSGLDNPVYNFMKHGQAIGVWTGNACSGSGSVTIDPQNKEPLYFDIEGYCSNKKTYIRPTFYVLYALPHTNQFQMLGLVRDGRFSTQNLDVNTTYDFKVIWGGNRSTLVTGKLADRPGNQVTVIVPKSEEASFCN